MHALQRASSSFDPAFLAIHGFFYNSSFFLEFIPEILEKKRMPEWTHNTGGAAGFGTQQHNASPHPRSSAAGVKVRRQSTRDATHDLLFL